jgi:hypothetical protein
MNLSQLKEQVRNILRERSVKAIQKDYSNVVDDIQKHLELYKKSKGTPEEKKHIGHLKTLGEKKKSLQKELDLAVSGLYKNAELKVDEAITNPKKSNPNDLATTVIGWYDFATDYIDDGGQRRTAIKNNEDVVKWFDSHPLDVKQKAFKVMLSKQPSIKSKIERVFGSSLKESVNEETSFNKNVSDIKSAFKTVYGDKVKDVKFVKTAGLKDGLVKVDFDIPARDLKNYGIGNSNPYLNKIEKLLSKKFKQDVFLNAFTVGNGSITYDLIGESVNEAKTYKKGDKLKIKLPNGKKFDVVFDMYSRTKGVALGKFKDGSGEYNTKPFNLDTIVESVLNEDTRRVKLLGIDFKVSEMNGRIFFSFVDKKAASVSLRQVGTNKIVNHIQNRLDIAYGKGTFFFKSGDHAEFQNGYLFQRNTPDINLNKLKFESVNEGKLSISQLPFKFLFNYPIAHTSTPGNFQDWYRDGMKLKKGRIEKFSPEDDKQLRSLINIWWDEVDDVPMADFHNGRDSKEIKKVKKDILDFLIKKSKVISESVNENEVSYKVAGRPVTLIKGKKSNGFDWKVKFQNGKETSLIDVIALIKPFPPITNKRVNEASEPEIISQLKDIVKHKQYKMIKDPKTGKSLGVDMQTANAVLQIYDGLSNVNKDNMVKMGLPKMIDVSFKIINKYKK